MTSKTTHSLSNINLLTNAQYEAIEEPSENELYAVETTGIKEFDYDAQTFYFSYSSGYIVQTGYKADGDTEVTFAYPFATTNYFVTFMPYGAAPSETPYITDKTAEGFTTISDGLWFKAEGY